MACQTLHTHLECTLQHFRDQVSWFYKMLNCILTVHGSWHSHVSHPSCPITKPNGQCIRHRAGGHSKTMKIIALYNLVLCLTKYYISMRRGVKCAMIWVGTENEATWRWCEPTCLSLVALFLPWPMSPLTDVYCIDPCGLWPWPMWPLTLTHNAVRLYIHAKCSKITIFCLVTLTFDLRPWPSKST